jgi:hypothetical protein
MPPKRRPTSAQQGKSLAILLIVVGTLVGVVLSYFAWEGGVGLWIVLLIAAIAEADTGGYAGFSRPTVPSGLPEERKAMHYQAVKHMMWMLFWPSDLWDNGFPETALLITALAGVLIGVLPLHAVVISKRTIDPLWLHLANGLLGALGVHAIYSFTRRKRDSRLPLTTVQDRIASVAKKELVALIIVSGISLFAGIIAVNFYALWLHETGLARTLVDASGGLIVALCVLVIWSSAEDRKRASELAEIESQWYSRWTLIGLKNIPTYITHKEVVEGVTLDYFSCPAGDSLMTYLSPKVTDTLNEDNSFIFVTQARQLDDDLNEPRYMGPGSLSVNTFRVCTWSRDAEPTFAGEEIDIDLYGLWIECTFASGLRNVGVGVPHLANIELVSEPESPAPLFHVFFGWPDGPDGSLDLEPYLGAVAQVGTAYLSDSYRQPDDPEREKYFGTSERFFVGDFNSATLSDELKKHIEVIIGSQGWDETWHATGIHDNPTWLQEMDREYTLTDSGGMELGEVSVSSFALAMGQTFTDAVVGKGRRTEALKTAMQLPSVAIVKHIQGTTVNEQIIDVVQVEDSQLPMDLSTYSSSSKQGVVLYANYILDVLAVKYKTDPAFAVNARVVSIPQDTDDDDVANRDCSAGNIWRLQVMVSGIATFTTFQNQAEDIKRTLGAKWVRMEWNDSIRAGQPNNSFYLYVGIARPVAERSYDQDTVALMNRLDLQSAWAIARVVNTNGDVPTLIESTRLSEHSDVELYKFTLPDGITPEKVAGAVSALKTASGFGFIQVLPVGDTPSTVQLIASPTDPLKPMELYQPNVATAKSGLSLGKGIDGESVSFDTATTPHLLINGPTGTGKAQPLDEIIPVPVCKKFPNGIAAIAQIEVGDRVFDHQGKPTKVTALSSITWAAENIVTLSNGVQVRCSPDHLWRIQRPRPNGNIVQSIVASGVRHILSGDKGTKLSEEAQALVNSATGSNPMLDAVVTTAELCNLVGSAYISMPNMFDNTASADSIRGDILSGSLPWQNAYGLPVLERHELLLDLLDRDGKTDATCTIASTLGRAVVRDEAGRWIDVCLTPGKVGVETVRMSGERIPMRCLVIENPHHLYLAAGGVPTHNSVLQSNIILAALQRGDDVYVIDPIKHMADYQLFLPYLAGYASESVIEAAGLVAVINEEFTRRKAINAKYGASNGRSPEIPEEERYPAMLIILDEATSLLMLDKQKGSDITSFDTEETNYRVTREAEERSKAVIGSTVSNIAREARAALVSLVLGMQKLDSKILDSLPLHKDAKENAGRVLLGVSSQAVRQSVLRQPEKTPKVEAAANGEAMVGRGVYEPISGSGKLFQAWYFESGQMAAYLESLNLPVVAERPDPLDHLATEIRALLDDVDEGAEAIADVTDDISLDDDDFLATLLELEGEPEPVVELTPNAVDIDSEGEFALDEDTEPELDTELDSEDEESEGNADLKLEDDTEFGVAPSRIDTNIESEGVNDYEFEGDDEEPEVLAEDPWEARRKRRAQEAKRQESGRSAAINALIAIPPQNE